MGVVRRRRPAAWWAFGGAGVGLTSVVLVSTVAFACTEIMGSLVLSPTSGPAGTVITTTATGLKPKPAKYVMHFAIGGGDCMAFDSTVVTLGKAIATSTGGGWTNVSRTIPKNATQGTHSVCGMEIYPIQANTGTEHDSFTVL